jgi:hypothetical protein
MVPTEPNNLAAPAEHDCLAASTESEKTLQQLCNAAHCSQSHMLLLSFSLVVIIFLICRTFFFSHSILEVESDTEDLESQNEDDQPSVGLTVGVGNTGSSKQFIVAHSLLDLLILILPAWFPQPKTMPDWLYKHFGDVIGPLILKKTGCNLAKPGVFADTRPYSPASFWIYPPEPAISLSLHWFDPPIFYYPQVFLWLPHFFCHQIMLPSLQQTS